jgi:2-(1,2-epoxy-1,2-dihydrophenyl)acetyl-CoA isomerase
MADTVILEKKNGIAKIFFNDPKTFNSFNLDTITRFAETVITIAADDSISGVIVSGTGKAFCTGGDLKWASSYPQGAPAAFHELSSRLHQSIAEIRNMNKPVIAAVNGIAAGAGFSIALACDFRIMSEGAIFKQGFTSNGLSIDGGGTWSLPRLVGIARALEIMAFDEPITPEKALQYGLVNSIVEDDVIISESEKMLMRILKIPLSSFARSKQLLYGSFNTTFESQLERERAGLSACAEHPDGQEGIRAFIEKRKPKFSSSNY